MNTAPARYISIPPPARPPGQGRISPFLRVSLHDPSKPKSFFIPFWNSAGCVVQVQRATDGFPGSKSFTFYEMPSKFLFKSNYSRCIFPFPYSSATHPSHHSALRHTT